MSQLPTNPILAALPSESVIGVYQQDSPSMLPRAHVVPRPLRVQIILDTSPVISTPQFSCRRVK